MLRAALRLIALSLLTVFPTLVAGPAQAETWTNCGAQVVSYYVLYNPPPTLLLLKEFYRDTVAPLIPGPTEYRIANELTAAAGGDILYGICADEAAGFELVSGVASKLKLASELYLLRNFGGVPIGVLFRDMNQNASGGGIAVQNFFQCTVEIDGQLLLEHPAIHNAALFHTGADLAAINASPALIEQYWASPIRQRLQAATQAWVEANTDCIAIDKAQFVQLMEDGARPLDIYNVVDPTHGVGPSIP